MSWLRVPLRPDIAERLSGTPCVLLLDIDGTLAPTAPRPSDARIPDETRAVLTALAARPDMRVALVSGRAVENARQLAALGSAHVWFIGNHGVEFSEPGGGIEVDPRVRTYKSAVAAAAVRVTEIAREVPGAFVEDKDWTLSVHYRLSDPRIVPELLAAVGQAASECGLRVFHGKKVADLRPPVRVNKGTASLDFARRVGGLVDGSSGLCAGDDQTDEEAFAALRESWPRAVTIRVGAPEDGSSTSAECVVETPAALLEILRALLAR